ncbi:MAG: hypothetical protein BGO90_11435 [Legionella sp. 40-6]|nr:MAG: hypothetical protein BGO90_11435 [Legionella sp. 40-6]
MSKIYEQLCSAVKNRNQTEIEVVLNLIKNLHKEKNHQEIYKLHDLLRTEFDNYLLTNNIDIANETMIKLKLQNLGFKMNNTKRPRAKTNDNNHRPRKKFRPENEYTTTLPDFFVPQSNVSEKPPSSTFTGAIRPNYTQVAHNFFTPEPVSSNKNSLVTESDLSNSTQKKLKATKKNKIPLDAGFIEQLNHVIKYPKDIKKMIFESLSLAEIETRVRECVDLVADADLEPNVKYRIYSLLLNQAHNLYLYNEKRVNNEPEKFPFIICLHSLYKHQKHSEITTLFTKHSLDTFMLLERIYDVFTKYYKDSDFYRTMELMDSQTIHYIATPSILSFLDRELKIAPFDLKRLLLKDHTQERIEELQQERLKNPESKINYEKISNKTYSPQVEPFRGEQEHAPITTNSLPTQNYFPAAHDYYHQPVSYPEFNTFNFYNPVHIHYNFIMAPHQNEPVQTAPPLQSWTNYSAPVMYTQPPQEGSSNNESTKASQQGLFSAPTERRDNSSDDDKRSKISIKNLLNK